MGTEYLATLFRRCARLGVLLAILPGYVLSQENRPKFQIVAQVSDASGAVVVGATVQIQNISTALKFSGTTNEAGEFRIDLEAGEYNVSVMQLGFKALTQQMEVASADDQRFRFVLEAATVVCTVPCLPPFILIETEMSKLPDQLDLPPFPIVPPLKPQDLRRNPIVRFFSAIGHQFGS